MCDVLCQTFNEQDQVVTVGEPLVHVRNFFFCHVSSSLPRSPLPPPDLAPPSVH